VYFINVSEESLLFILIEYVEEDIGHFGAFCLSLASSLLHAESDPGALNKLLHLAKIRSNFMIQRHYLKVC